MSNHIAHLRYRAQHHAFGSASELVAICRGESLVGEPVAIEYRRPSGMIASLFVDVCDGLVFRASYGPAGFPMPHVDGITSDDLVEFLAEEST